MSFVDLATLALHRRSEMETRINTFVAKCNQAIENIMKLKTHTQMFVDQLNCDPSELKERFLSCMKQLDEYTYLITDFNLSIGKLEPTGNIEYTPVHDTSRILLPQQALPVNIMDMLSEPAPSTSSTCTNCCLPEKPKKHRVPKEEQCLIQFSSASSSSESVPMAKSGNTLEKKGQEVLCKISHEAPSDDGGAALLESCNLPAQSVLQTDHVYPAIIMNIDGASFWVITDDAAEVHNLMTDMTQYYAQHRVKMALEEVKALTYCAFYDAESDCYYRGLFIRLSEEDPSVAEVFLVDTGEIRAGSALGGVQPLAARFCGKPPYARCCHLAGVDLLSFHNKDVMEKQEEFMKQYIGANCSIEVDDNTSESLGVYVMMPPNNEILNDMLVAKQLAFPISVPADEPAATNSPATADRQSTSRAHTPAPAHGPPELKSRESDLDIMNCPEYEDPVEAVTGYSCRDEADICKHYKGGPDKTCFKGSRCKKKHILIHPDGWTQDRVEVVAKCRSMPLPAPGTWHRVRVTCVLHFDRLFVQFVKGKKKVTEPPSFGVLLPPASLEALEQDMNSAAAQIAYKPLKVAPAPGEIVAARYPPDERWYRARVLSAVRADQCVEVMYVDYGNVVWVREDAVRALDTRYLALPLQAVRCALAGVEARGHDSARWADAKRRLDEMTRDRVLDARVIARDYDEITVEMFDAEGYSIAEQLAVLKLVNLAEYDVLDDTNVRQKHVVP